MPSTYSPSLRLELIGAGEQSGTWGATTNTNLGTLLDQSIAGVQSITMVNTNYVLTNFNGVSDEARKAVIVVGGTNLAIRDVIAPLVPKTYVIKNNTTGGFAINIRASSGASAVIPNGVSATVYCDGTNFVTGGYILAAGIGISIATASGITTITNTSNLPAGTALPFFNTSAPTGWTQNVSYVNHMLRVVATAGGASGGTMSPILNNVVPAHTHGFTTGAQSATHNHVDIGHTHTVNIPFNLRATPAGTIPTAPQSSTSVYSIVSQTGYANLGVESASHIHSGSTDNGSSQTNWTPQYVDMIICTKN
jgi:hypothetical protein